MKYIIISIILLSVGCTSKFNKENFIGIWESSDSAVLEFKNDGKCKISELNYYKIYPFDEYKDQLLTFEGIWSLSSDGDRSKLHVSYNTGKKYEYKNDTIDVINGFDLYILEDKVYLRIVLLGIYIY